jgi:hypothetical protein
MPAVADQRPVSARDGRSAATSIFTNCECDLHRSRICRQNDDRSRRGTNAISHLNIRDSSRIRCEVRSFRDRGRRAMRLTAPAAPAAPGNAGIRRSDAGAQRSRRERRCRHFRETKLKARAIARVDSDGKRRQCVANPAQPDRCTAFLSKSPSFQRMSDRHFQKENTIVLLNSASPFPTDRLANSVWTFFVSPRCTCWRVTADGQKRVSSRSAFQCNRGSCC